MASSPEGSPAIPEFAQHSRRFFRRVLVVGVLLAGVGLAAWPAYRAAKVWRSVQVAREASGLLAANDFLHAAPRVRVALKLGPREPEVLRVAAEYCTRRHDPQAITYWEFLLATGAANRADRLAYARLALEVGRPDLAAAIAQEGLRTAPGDPEFLGLAADLMELRGDLTGAVAACRDWVRWAPGDESALFHLGRLLGRHPNGEARIEGRRILWGLALRTGGRQVAAIRLLAGHEELAAEERQLLIRTARAAVSGAGNDPVLLGLVVLELRRAGDPGLGLGGLAAEALALLGDSPTVSQRVAVADWCLGKGQAASALVAAPFEAARRHPDLLTRHLQALAELNRWEEMAGLTEDDGLPIPEPARHCFRAMIDARRGFPQTVPVHLANAITASGGHLEFLERVAETARELGHPLLAIRALEPLLGDSRLVVPASRRILGLLQDVDAIPPHRRLVKRLLELNPGDPALENDRVWLELIEEPDSVSAGATAERLHRERPEDLLVTATAALARLRRNDAEGALALFDSAAGGSDRLDQAPPRSRLVYAAALGAAGQREAARRAVQRLNGLHYRPEELQLIEPWSEVGNFRGADFRGSR